MTNDSWPHPLHKIMTEVERPALRGATVREDDAPWRPVDVSDAIRRPTIPSSSITQNNEEIVRHHNRVEGHGAGRWSRLADAEACRGCQPFPPLPIAWR